jgi:hypothetical protein
MRFVMQINIVFFKLVGAPKYAIKAEGTAAALILNFGA